ncbi:MAG TPA: glutamate 5-kinase [Pyrinomonadaceae bacterium]|nr:glutamate 5-kinase [Pyrinomonadaceae bacterium]
MEKAGRPKTGAARERLRAARRIVVKLGTSVVTGAGGEVSAGHLEPVVNSLINLKRDGRQVVLVSSGAVGLGARHLELKSGRLNDVVMRQACAAVGQSLLMHAYEKLFGAGGVKIAQVLLTEADFTDRGRYSTLRRTMEKLLKLDVLPIVNENDTVSIAELEYLNEGRARVFSDNDRLAALVMSKLDADALVLLSDVDGLQDRRAPGGIEEEVKAIPVVNEVTPELRALALGPSEGGRGGMLTKLDAARIAMQSGGVAVIANGQKPDTLGRVFAGEEVGTVFVSQSRMAGKRRWIAYAAGVHGCFIVNDGAREAIVKSKASLLSSGVVRIENRFDPLDVVGIADTEGREFARGIVTCASAEAEKLIQEKGRNEADARKHILITRDNIVLLEN